MIQANIFEQLQVFVKILKSQNNIFVIIGSILVSLLVLILANIFKNKKITKIIYFVIYLVIFSYLIYAYHFEILNLLDYLINNIFILLFFPNLAVYILVLTIANILIIKSTFSKNDNKLIRYMNTLFFVIFNVFFYLIVNKIIDNDINVYDQLDIYTNNDLLILIELNMKLFLIWLIVLLVNKFINKVNIYSLNRKQINSKIILEKSNSTDEFKNVSDNLNIVEVVPIQDKYNDYVNIEPIKKHKNINIKEEIREEKNSKILTLDEVLNNSVSAIVDKETEIKKEEKKNNEQIVLSSYDKIFKNIQLPVSEYNMDMDNIFNSKENYLNDILKDIEKLKDNKKDTLQINKIYQQIKMNVEELSLTDYNFLINCLLEIKNN